MLNAFRIFKTNLPALDTLHFCCAQDCGRGLNLASIRHVQLRGEGRAKEWQSALLPVVRE